MFLRTRWLLQFCTVIRTGTNSINPVGSFVAYGHYFPKQWSQQFIHTQLDPTKRNLTSVQLICNRVGRPTGKVLLRFATQEGMDRCIQKYNQDFIVTKEEAHRVVIKPFQLKTIAKKQQVGDRRTKHAVKVKNLDFDISGQELEGVAKDYGKVEFVQMQIRPNGLNDGMAIIYFRKAKEAADFAYFCQDLVLRERKLTADVINFKATNNDIAYLEEPQITIEANERLYKRMLAEEVRKREEQKTKQ